MTAILHPTPQELHFIHSKRPDWDEDTWYWDGDSIFRGVNIDVYVDEVRDRRTKLYKSGNSLYLRDCEDYCESVPIPVLLEFLRAKGYKITEPTKPEGNE